MQLIIVGFGTPAPILKVLWWERTTDSVWQANGPTKCRTALKVINYCCYWLNFVWQGHVCLYTFLNN